MPVPIYRTHRNVDQQRTLRDLQLRLARSLIWLVAVVLISTTGFVIFWGAELPLPERVTLAFWDTLNLISTVGSLHGSLTPGQRGWAALVIIFGLGAVLYAYGNLQALLVGGELGHQFARRTMHKRLEATRGHYIVCGYGEVGSRAAERLHRAGRPLVVVDRARAAAETANEAGYLVVHGDCENEQTLVDAGILRAAGIVATLDGDASNVYLCLIARDLVPSIRIVSRATGPESRRALERAGANRVIVPGEMAGVQLSHQILMPRVSEFVSGAIGDGEYEFAEVEVGGHPGLVGRSLGELDLPNRAEVLVISVHEASGAQVFSPPNERRIAADDVLIVVGREGILDRLRAAEGA